MIRTVMNRIVTTGNKWYVSRAFGIVYLLVNKEVLYIFNYNVGCGKVKE